MDFDAGILTSEERVILSLRSLFHRYGYSRYKMSKFEEYDLYAKNKDFLMTDNIITFTDINGKLMALKPDVTLSIVRNSRDAASGVQKVYYNENVYRVTRSGHNFKEITQIGLECIGDIDDYHLSEVVLLALRSMECASDRFRLTISQTDLLSQAVKALGLSDEDTCEVLRCVGQKNLHELNTLIQNADKDAAEQLVKLMTISENPKNALAEIETLGFDSGAVSRLKRLIDTVEKSGYGEQLSIDFSIVGDTSYYNGIAFKGYISGIPEAVVSGGQYDKLMRRMGRTSKAIGFAVYMDLLERLDSGADGYDTDMLLVYDDNVDSAAVCRKVGQLTRRGLRVLAVKDVPEDIKYRQIAKFDGSEDGFIEYNA